MSIAESLLVAMCANPNNKELQACQALARATYSINRDNFAKVNEFEEQLVRETPVWLKHTIVLFDALDKRYIYIPIVDKKW